MFTKQNFIHIKIKIVNKLSLTFPIAEGVIEKDSPSWAGGLQRTNSTLHFIQSSIFIHLFLKWIKFQTIS